MDQQSVIFKICTRAEWDEACSQGEFRGSGIDLQDGFIHFSAKSQVKETAAKHFAGKSNLVLVSVETGRLGDALKWEVSRGGDLFPHLYASLSIDAVSRVVDLPINPNGQHEFPDEL